MTLLSLAHRHEQSRGHSIPEMEYDWMRPIPPCFDPKETFAFSPPSIGAGQFLVWDRTLARLPEGAPDTSVLTCFSDKPWEQIGLQQWSEAAIDEARQALDRLRSRANEDPHQWAEKLASDIGVFKD